jgi:hypothetical protein
LPVLRSFCGSHTPYPDGSVTNSAIALDAVAERKMFSGKKGKKESFFSFGKKEFFPRKKRVRKKGKKESE